MECIKTKRMTEGNWKEEMKKRVKENCGKKENSTKVKEQCGRTERHGKNQKRGKKLTEMKERKKITQ